MQRTATTKTYFRSAGVTVKVVNSKRKASNFFNKGLEKTNEKEENIAWKQGVFFIFRSFRKPGKDNLHEYCNYRRK